MKHCSRPRCPNPAVRGGKCAAHLAEYEAKRGTAAERGYDDNWRRIRAVVLKREPLCRRCHARGVTRRATDVHHIDGSGPKGNNHLSNLEPLCHEHHSAVTLAAIRR